MGEQSLPYRVEVHTAGGSYRWRYQHYPVPAGVPSPGADVVFTHPIQTGTR